MSRGWRSARARGVALAACAVASIAVPALSGCGTGVLRPHGGGAPGPAATSAAPATYAVTARVTAVVITGGAGTITVTGAARPAVSVTERAYYSNSAKPPATRHQVSGTTLTLSYSCPAQLTCGVAYDVRVPRGVAVRASDREGAITLTGLAGPVRATTLAGVITATGLTSPSASFTSAAGAITAAFSAVPASVSASTHAGPVTLRLPGSAAYQVHARAYVGTSTVTVPRSATSRNVITATCDIGTVTISPS